MLEQIIRASGHNKSSFARFIGVNRKTIHNWVKKNSRFDIFECAELEKKLQLENGELYAVLTGNTKNSSQVLEKLSKLEPEKAKQAESAPASPSGHSSNSRNEKHKSIWDGDTEFVIGGTLKTPFIEFDMTKGALKIRGRSVPESAINFYKPLEQAMERFMEMVPKKELTIDVSLEYLNTASTKKLLDIFKMAEDYYKKGTKVQVLWNYDIDDDDSLEMGEDYQAIINIPFKFNELQK